MKLTACARCNVPDLKELLVRTVPLCGFGVGKGNSKGRKDVLRAVVLDLR